MYPSSCSRSKDCGRTLYNTLYRGVGGILSGETNSHGTYAPIIPHEAIYVPSEGILIGTYQGDNLRPWMWAFDPETQERTASPVSIGGSGLTNDSHGAPELAIDDSGYIYVYWGCHAGLVYWRKSTNPYDVSAWGTQYSISIAGTYPGVYKIGSSWYLFHRSHTVYPLAWAYNVSADLSSWGSNVDFLTPEGGNDAPYLIAQQDPIGRMHFLWCLWDRVALTNRNLYYACADDMSTIHKADGTPYSLPITTAAAECLITAPEARAQYSDINFDASNRPCIMANVGFYWTFFRWTGTEWATTTITPLESNNSQFSCAELFPMDAYGNIRAILDYAHVTPAHTYVDVREYRSSNYGASWTYVGTYGKMVFRGGHYRVVNGFPGCEIYSCGSEQNPRDLWIF